MDPVLAMTLAEVLAAIVLITLQLAIAHFSGLQVELIVASFLDQASLHPSEEIWFQKPRRKPLDKTRVNASRGFSTHSLKDTWDWRGAASAERRRDRPSFWGEDLLWRTSKTCVRKDRSQAVNVSAGV